MIEIIDDFLPEEHYNFLHKEFNDRHFPWHLSTTSHTFDSLPVGKVNIFNAESRLLFHFFIMPQSKKSHFCLII